MTPAAINRLVVASANPDKAIEIVEILGSVFADAIEILPRPTTLGEIDETGTTLLANARLKAVAVCSASGEAAIADDTGLEVDALDGAPGVYSARFAGIGVSYADNVAKLLAVLQGVKDRRASFRTVALIAFPNGAEISAEGAVQGVIAAAPRGSGGFGYDSVFLPDGSGGRSYGEMTASEKNALSHRGRTLRALADKLEHFQAPPV